MSNLKSSSLNPHEQLVNHLVISPIRIKSCIDNTMSLKSSSPSHNISFNPHNIITHNPSLSLNIIFLHSVYINQLSRYQQWSCTNNNKMSLVYFLISSQSTSSSAHDHLVILPIAITTKSSCTFKNPSYMPPPPCLLMLFALRTVLVAGTTNEVVRNST